MKVCSDCGENKPFEDYYSQKKYSKKRGDYIYYNPYCKLCNILRSEKWQEENREQALDNYKDLYARKKDDPRRVNQIRVAAKSFRDKGGHRIWYQNNKDKSSQYGKDRRENKTHQINNDEWELCKKYFDYSCAYCGLSIEEHKEEFKQDLHREHVDHEGPNDLSNCIPACKSCNCQKWTYEMEYWYKNRSEKYSEIKYNKILKWINEDHKLYISKIIL